MKTRIVTRILSVTAILSLLAMAALAGQLGGYRVIDKADDNVMAAAEFAVTAESEKKEMTYKLVSVEKAESQSAAGTNFRLCLKVGYHKQDDDVDTTEFVKVIVHRNLQQEFSLTSWTEEQCSSDSE